MLAKPLAVCNHLSLTSSYSNRNCKKSPFSRTADHILFPLETPLRLSRSLMLAKPLAACTHLSSTVSQLFEPQVQKIDVFTYCSPHFVSPGDAPATITQYGFNACQTPRSMCLSIFNSFRVIRCLSQCVSPKIAIFTTFWFPLWTPLGQSR